MAKEMNWKRAIEKTLKDAGTPMHYGEVAEAVVSNGLKAKVGATPANSVVAIIGCDVRPKNLPGSVNKDLSEGSIGKER